MLQAVDEGVRSYFAACLFGCKGGWAPIDLKASKGRRSVLPGQTGRQPALLPSIRRRSVGGVRSAAGLVTASWPKLSMTCVAKAVWNTVVAFAIQPNPRETILSREMAFTGLVRGLIDIQSG